MFRQALVTQWKASRLFVIPMATVAFALPLLSIQGMSGYREMVEAGRAFGLEYPPTAMILWLPLFPLTAVVLGTLVAVGAWSWDHRQGHVYSLSLPLHRWEYVLLKFGASGVLLLGVVLFFWLGCMVASMAVDLPDGLNTYPNLLTLRFLLSAAVIYGAAFAFLSGTLPTAGKVLIGFGLTVIALSLLGGIASEFYPAAAEWSVWDGLRTVLVRWPGPLEPLTGSWMLIDV